MRRRRTALLLVLGGTAIVAAALASPVRAQPGARPGGDAELGAQLFATGCSSCHGPKGEGTRRGPSLAGVGAASVDFWVSSGRMPLDQSDEQAVRKPPTYERKEIDAIIAYVSSVQPGGPPIPELDLEAADVVEGGTLFRANCAACHGAVGIGGALASGRQAPALKPATAVQVAEAIRVGPGLMPSFGPETFTDEQLAAVVKYVEELDSPEDPGGSGLGHAGPIPEGFVGWFVGLGALLVACWWIGERE